ncbi:phosphopentomutase [Epibacterium sp. SM1979]|uniref:Phosphopentomutase n=1 Tax=Tritonibacter litoralis TaxID=2662264 RepID=A0A843YL38_9RHOB|nr:phosphopentomutase [Tritonibacter litoralis]MQQ09962.1 phosphopentomutase [Tritonibacter litoralis]
MARAFLVVMDSVGVGHAPDAGLFFNGNLPDLGANTLGHIAEACARGQANTGRAGPLRMPHLDQLGLGAAMQSLSGRLVPGLGAKPTGLWGTAVEASPGKDTPTGHWELAGVPVPWTWHVFPQTAPCFPAELMREVAHLAQASGTLGNCHASGTAIIEQLGQTHIETGQPICYTSADSVFQIAAHEVHFGLDRLLTLCEAMAPRLHAMRVGRVIARPFVGDVTGGFTRTANRRDFAVAPPKPTLLEQVQAAGGTVHGIGKIGDIFSMKGIDTLDKGTDAQLMEHLLHRAQTARDGSLTVANFVEFDSLFGHRRDVSGYACALEWFDREIAPVLAALRPGDMMVFTADHGNDPTWPGTDHTREQVPVLVAGVGAGSLGQIRFVDVAGLLAKHLGFAAQ